MGENKEKVNVTANIDLTSVMALLIENNSYLKVLFEYKVEEISGEKSGDKYTEVYNELENARELYAQKSRKAYSNNNA